MWLLIAGGVPMVFVVVFGLVSVLAAARYAYAPGDGRFGHLVALSGSVVAAAIAGCAADLMAAAMHIADNEAWTSGPDFPVYVLMGFGESMSPLILGFGLVAATAVLTAVGLRRSPAHA